MPVTKTVRTVTTRNADGDIMTTQTVEETVETYDFPGNKHENRPELASQPPVTEAQVVAAKAELDGAKDL